MLKKPSHLEEGKGVGLRDLKCSVSSVVTTSIKLDEGKCEAGSWGGEQMF